MICLGFRAMAKSTLQGFADLQLDSGLVLYDCPVHAKGGERWIGFPARQYIDKTGVQKWKLIVGFADDMPPERRKAFTEQAVAAVDAFNGGDNALQEEEGRGTELPWLMP